MDPMAPLGHIGVEFGNAIDDRHDTWFPGCNRGSLTTGNCRVNDSVARMIRAWRHIKRSIARARQSRSDNHANAAMSDAYP